GRIAEAVRLAERAAVLDPAPIRRGIAAWLRILDDRTDEALPLLRQAVADAGGRLKVIAAVIVREEARRGNWDAAEQAGLEHFDREYVTQLFRALRAGDPSMAPRPIDAEQWMWLGYPDSAVAVYDVGPDEIFQLDLYRVWLPVFDPIRDRPEIQAFLRNAGLEGAQLQRTPRSEGDTAGGGGSGPP
ncbi:MAG TPA: hypothetical protein VMN39_07620, partial [Longimicrobiaceae bacterium]|nr:hypothetical protein [Longimicrobiaceae bacterium]